MKCSHLKYLIMSVIAVSSLWGCSDDMPIPEAGSTVPIADAEQFWYSRTRSAQENQVMMRHHALGFSYQALSGQKCYVGDVMCQVLNLDYLDEKGLVSTSTVPEVNSTSNVQRGVMDIIHGAQWVAGVSADLILYQTDKRKEYYMVENVKDSTLVMQNTIDVKFGRSDIDLFELLGSQEEDNDVVDSEHRDNKDIILSDNFRYALSKLEANRTNVAVIDSFINIFGTHVVTGVTTGGQCDLKLVTSKRLVKSYVEEEEYSREAVNLLFKNTETIEKLTDQTSFLNLFRSAQLFLKVKGGDVSRFDQLVANPSYDDDRANYSNFSSWLESLSETSGLGWDQGAELIDMDVTPIWRFIPDADLAKRVKARVVATASTMRDLYGEQNFTTAEIKVPDWDDTMAALMEGSLFDFGPSYLFEPDICSVDLSCAAANVSICHAVKDIKGRPSRIVAVSYYEYIPELAALGENPFIYVTYPVYENRIQLDQGIGRCNSENPAHNGWYTVKWLYDRFKVERIDAANTDKLYLYMGKLYLSKPAYAHEPWLETSYLPDYEMPGSLNIDGSLNAEAPYKTVVKFLNRFYFINEFNRVPDGYGGIADLRYDNLPGWYYSNSAPEELVSDYYMRSIFSKSGIYTLETAFKFVGLNYDSTGRMIRNSNYRYKIIPTELGF